MISETPQTVAQEGDLPVETSGLTKRYGPRVTAVADLDLTVRRGEVYGFLGPNGSGKTTTLRMLLGLVRPTSGKAWVLGKEPGDPASFRRIGALVESPAFYPYLSGRDNLRAMASYAGAPHARVKEALETVELTGWAKTKVKKYSSGMKQRLGVAVALLKDPELLILDEPTNGLDPKGMADVRELIRKVARDGRTVLLSSHLLGEVEQTCDRVGIVREGRMIAEAPVEELRNREGLAIRAKPLSAALSAAQTLPGVEKAWVDAGMLRLLTDPGRAADINAGLVLAGLEVSEIRPAERSLEEVFLQLTGERDARADAAASSTGDGLVR